MTLHKQALYRGHGIALYFLVSIVLATTSHATSSHRVSVSLLKQESSVRTSAVNRDAYIVRIQSKSGRVFVARIVDQYPGYSPRPVFFPTTSDIHYSVSLRRASYCDSVTDGVELQCFEVIHSSWHVPKSAEDQWWK